jgi:hypothetical protein
MAYTTINKGSDYFNTLLYSGDGSSPRNLTGVGFQPDFTWIKQRSSTNTHVLWDAVRGAGADKEICTASSGAEGGQESSLYGYLSSFDSDGFTATAGSTNIGWVNNSGQTYASWNWLANGAGSSNTDGTITSTVSASTTSGFSIVTYAGNSTVGATIGHGLGVAPEIVFYKSTTAAFDWLVYSKALGATKELVLNSTAAGTTSSVFNNQDPTSTNLIVSNNAGNNSSSHSYVAYCFAPKKGFSKMGSHVGNGSTNGTFIYTGFKPAFFLLKPSSGTGQWFIWDSTRSPINQVQKYLSPEANFAEGDSSGAAVDFVSNGVKIRNSDGGINQNGITYITMAFAENPLVSSTGTPVTAR